MDSLDGLRTTCNIFLAVIESLITWKLMGLIMMYNVSKITFNCLTVLITLSNIRQKARLAMSTFNV